MDDQTRSATMEALKRADYRWLILSIIFGIMSHMSRAQRWRMLIKPMGYSPRYFVTFLTVMISYVANLAAPRLGEVMKCTFLSRYERIPADKLIGTMIAERSIDAITLLLVTGLTLIFQYDKIIGFWNVKVTIPVKEKLASSSSFGPLLIGGLVLAIILFWLAGRVLKNSKFFEKVQGVLRNMKEGLGSVRKVENLPLFIFHSLFIWFMYFAMVAVCFPALAETAMLGVPAGMAILVFGSFGIIASPGGIGAYQLIVKETLENLYQVPEAAAFAFGNIVWGAQTIMIVLFGLLAFLILPLFKRQDGDARQTTK
ncbi:MAG: hypothetical protein ACI959_000007 [Limisphaerales bacterium]|jgi:uncharacterized protein (TIRG00374 family)